MAKRRKSRPSRSRKQAPTRTKSSAQRAATRQRTTDKILAAPLTKPPRGASKRERQKWAREVLASAKQLGLTRSQRRTAKADDKFIEKLFRKNKDVLTGKKVLGRIKGKTVKLPVSRQEIRAGEVRVVRIPIDFKTMHQYLTDLKKRKELEKLKPPGAAWGFKVFGHPSYNTFSSLAAMAREFEHYDAVKAGLAGRHSIGARWADHLAYISVAAKDWGKLQLRSVKAGPRLKKKRARK